MTFAGSIYTDRPASQFLIGGQTLIPGGSIDPFGTPIMLGPGEFQLLQLLSSPSVAQPTQPTPFGDFFISRQILTLGGALTIRNTPNSLLPDGTAAVVGSSTQLIHLAGATGVPAFTFNGATSTADSAGALW